MSEEQERLDALESAIIKKLNRLADRVERGERLERVEFDQTKLQLLRTAKGLPE